MSEHDELVEKVKGMILSTYLDMDASDLAKRMNAGMSAHEAVKLLLNGIIPEVISAYRHVAMPTAGDGWQDIASAPRDQPVLIANSGLGHVNRQIALRRDYAESGWVDQFAQPIAVSAKPTHWRPLPPPPGAKP